MINRISIMSFCLSEPSFIKKYAEELNCAYFDISYANPSDLPVSRDSEFYFFVSNYDFENAFKMLKELKSLLPIVSKIVVFLDKFNIKEREEIEKLGIELILPFENIISSQDILLFLFRKVNEINFKNKILQSQLTQSIYNQRELNKIGVALSSEHNLDRLLGMILSESRSITNSDSGSIYIVEDDVTATNANERDAQPVLGARQGVINYPRKKEYLDDKGSKTLKFKITQNDSVNIYLEEFKLPISEKSVAGYVCLTGEPVNIEDAYFLPENSTFSINREFDVKNNYRTKSMLTIPMKNRDGDVTGVIQLINKKLARGINITCENVHDNVLTYSSEDINIMYSIASQAAVSIEKAKLYREIENLFENFIESIVTAIDRRDKVTAGHSMRIAAYAVAIAHAMNNEKSGPFVDVYFDEWELKELKYAALLHDVGKIGVREDVLNKEKRVSGAELSYIIEKLKYANLKSHLNNSQGQNRGGSELYNDSMKKIREYLSCEIEKIKSINGKDRLVDDDISYIDQLAAIIYEDYDGRCGKLLSDTELKNLSIKYGTLNQEERKEIEAHMVYTNDILSKISWIRELRNVPQIAASHHEKLDGSGYPHGLRSAEIPLGGKILAMVDIFEALTAFDRPYKPPLSRETAIKILYDEAARNKLDKDIIDLFVKENIFESVSKEFR